MRRGARAFLACLACCWACASPRSSSDSACAHDFDPAPLVGLWRGRVGCQPIEEAWSLQPDGSLRGFGRWAAPSGETVFHEFLALERRDGAWCYLASPLGAPATSFRLDSASTAAHWIFLAPAHDNPRRIAYRFDGDARLVAEVGQELDGSDARRHEYSKAR